MSARDLPPGLVACRKIVGGECDPFAAVWDSLDDSERAFWLQVSRQGPYLSRRPWRDLPGDTRCKVKNGLFRAASRSSALLAAGAAS